MFKSTILTLPGIGGSGPQHWQSLWEKEYGFIRIEQKEWDTPDRADWVANIQNAVSKYDPIDIILVGHSAVCGAIIEWTRQYQTEIKGALLVAPADPEADTFPTGAVGFKPMPLINLPFPSIVVTSTNDYYVPLDCATQFAHSWGSELVNIGEAGHINVSSGFGKWDEGLEILKKLDNH
ncbi:RBBP9/YdeN family alpha/beta hydrolase [Mucilaginibacter sp. McL0603]|uniref:RBBP9/YdeN family alpha/beta hydrolase n=1 Tax=Mucilaginibacter sp. McL0603 TaxID=3415670 RepID=UPI003CF8D432